MPEIIKKLSCLSEIEPGLDRIINNQNSLKKQIEDLKNGFPAVFESAFTFPGYC